MREIESTAGLGSKVGHARGSYWQITAILSKMEKRGDVRVIWEGAYRDGIDRVIPFIRLRTVREIRRRVALRLTLAAGTVLVVVSTAATLLWQARHLIISAAGVLVLAWSAWWVARLHAHSPGCVGLHCPGCKG